MSSSAICSHFTQNAWKKDLCSNCFKSKDEHKPGNNAGTKLRCTSLNTTKIPTTTATTTTNNNNNQAKAKNSSYNSNNNLTTITETTTTKTTSDNNNKKTDYPNKYKMPVKSIIKKALSNSVKPLTGGKNKSQNHKVSFPKHLSEVIGYGGEWSDDSFGDDDDDDDDDDDADFMNLGNERIDENAATSTDDEESLELKRITIANTDFNMNNGNLLGDAQENIKRSFAALKLGAPQVDKEGKKQTLKINVVPFGSNAASTASATTTSSTGEQYANKQTINVSSTKTNSNNNNKSNNNATILAKIKFEPKTDASASPTTKSDTRSTPLEVNNSQKTTATTTTSVATSKASNSSNNDNNNKSALEQQQSEKKKKEEKSNDVEKSPPVERAMEKSLLDEISETLEQNQNDAKKILQTQAEAQAQATASKDNQAKVKFEIKSLTDALDESNKPFLDLKKSISRNPPITKEHTKPKVNIFPKYITSDTESNCSDNDNGVSAYYDVVEAQLSYENIPDGKDGKSAAQNQKETQNNNANNKNNDNNNDKNNNNNNENKSIYSSSQYITDMLLSSRTRAASYNLHEGNFMTSKITQDGLIVTKCNNAASDDALDSTGSSFDGSSDEETSYNMTRSESDSGIGISIGSHDYKNIAVAATEKERKLIEKKFSASNNNSDYEDIQVIDQQQQQQQQQQKLQNQKKEIAGNKTKNNFILEKCRELHGEPDGSADPDGTSIENKTAQQLPALPKSPPPTKIIDARPSFLHGLQKQNPTMLLKKPDLPAKPLVSPVNSPLKTFAMKRQVMMTPATTTTNNNNNNNNSSKNNSNNNEPQQQVISQLQTMIMMSKSNEQLSTADSAKDMDSKLKKGRAPIPPSELSTSAASSTSIATNEQQRRDESSAPPTPERDYSIIEDFIAAEQHNNKTNNKTSVAKLEVKLTSPHEQGEQTKKLLQQGIDNVKNRNEANSALTQNNLSFSVKENSKLESSGKQSVEVKDKDKEKVEKEKRTAINPKFRSLNTFVTQRNNAAKNLQLQSATSNVKHSMTPEPTPRNANNKILSMSEECLAANNNSKRSTPSMLPMGSTSNLFVMDYKKSTQSPVTQTKVKTKFSIKKFLRMGTSKTTDNLHKKNEGVYSEICTGDDSGVAGKPRLVIIHPIDINPTAVEVVKDITKTNDAVTTQTVAVVTSKPPAPPMRAHEINKPARPPPPKSAELRRKQQTVGFKINETKDHHVNDNMAAGGGSIKSKADNVYANLGEIRSSIAPRKPERTASMREREAQLELARKRHGCMRSENDTISICSSNGENVSADQQQSMNPNGPQQNYSGKSHMSISMSSNGSERNSLTANTFVEGKPPTGSRSGTIERRKAAETKASVASKLEIFEQRVQNNTDTGSTHSSYNSTSNAPSLKDSVRKITSTIDSYLKDKRDYENMYDFVKTASPPLPPARLMDLSNTQRILPRRSNLYSDSASVASFTRSEYVPNRSYGLNHSITNIPRVISASYCGSEVGEFDIYAPYSYYGSEACAGDIGADINDSVWGIPSAIKNRAKATNRLRMRKGRSVVHKNIEDNYTAVVVANHEALAQVLDQLQQTPVIPTALRPLANAINLRFEDFSIMEGGQAFVVGKKAFHAALWNTAPVTLALSADCNQLSGVGGDLNQLSGGVSGVFNPITEFCDIVPSYHLPLMPSTAVTLMQATISVLPRLQLDTLQSIGTILKGKSQVLDRSNFNFRGSIPNLSASNKESMSSSPSTLRNVVSVQNLSTLNEEVSNNSLEANAQSPTKVTVVNSTSNGAQQNPKGMPAFDDVMTREVAFIMLQLVNGMKNLQAKAIEEIPLSLSNVVLSKDVENKDSQARLCVLQGNNNDEDEPMGTLCRCAHIALTEMLPSTKITCILTDILIQERAESLSKCKSVLEFVLWGPSDVELSGSIKERELALQRWLDLERATVLHGLVRTRVELTVYDECHLMFLVRSTAKMMNDAAKIVYSYQEKMEQMPDT